MTAELSGAASAATRGRPLAIGAARVLMGLLGAVTTAGATYFTFFASPEQGGVAGPVDWVLGAWALAMGVGLVVAAVKLGRRPSQRSVRLAAALVGLHILFGLIKIFGYAETEVAAFLAFDAMILGLLAVGRPR